MSKLSKVLSLILAIIMVFNIGVLATETVDEAETTISEETTTTLPEESTDEPTTDVVEDTTTDTTEESTTEATTEETTDVTEEPTEATTEETTTEATTEETTTEVAEETTTAPEEETTAPEEEITTTPEEETTAPEEEPTTTPEEETTAPEEETTTTPEGETTAPEEEPTTTPKEETTTPEEIPTTTPDVTEPDVTEPTEPDVTEPDVTEPTEPDVTDPDVTEPTEPDVTEPTEPDVTEPDVTEPTEPDVTDPDVTDPTEPDVTEPDVTEPTEPDVTDPTEPEEPQVELPAVPANVSAGAFADGKVVIQWDAVEGATGYDVYLKSGDNWVLNGSVTKNKCSLKNIVYNSKYVVGVKSYVMIEDVKYESAEMTEYTVETGADIPEAKLTATASGDTITLKWDAIKGVSGYRVYIRKDGKWVKLTSSSENTYTYKKALPGKTYKFAIKPYAKGTEGTKFGALKTVKVAVENYSKTTVKATDKTTSSITIKWDKVKNASNYRVYIYKNGKWTYYKGITKNTYTIKGLKDATNYKIKVKASFKVDGKVYWGSYSNTITVATAGKEVTAKRIDNLKKQFTKDNWSVKVYLDKGTENEVALTFAVKGDMVYIKEAYKGDSDLITLCNVKTNDSYLISHEYKEYVVVPEPSYADYQYILVTMFAPLDAKNVKAKTTVYDGNRVVAEYYKGKDGIKRTYYFDGDKVVAVKLSDSDGFSSIYTSYKVLGKPADSLFKFPKGYKEGRY